MKINSSNFDLIGNTPILKADKFNKHIKTASNIFVKLEYLNPSGSVKDRAAKQMLLDALDNGLIDKATTIIEPTSGNTGIGLASLCASMGLKIILTMPETMSVERRNILKAYGAEIVLTEGSKGMKGAIAKAEELNKSAPNSIIIGQFTNKSNVKAHYLTTGPEIWNDLEGNVDVFISGIGTGGTVTGTGTYLKEKNKDIKIIAVEPSNSPIISKGTAGAHKIQGIGAGFIPEILNLDILDEVITVDDADSFSYSKTFAKTEGILVGISSGAALKAAHEIAQREEFKNKNIVVILPDSGDRYYSTPLFE